MMVSRMGRISDNVKNRPVYMVDNVKCPGGNGMDNVKNRLDGIVYDVR